MVDLGRLGILWNMMHGSSADPHDIEIADMLISLSAELAERRREPVVTGPSVTERLERCRDRAATIVAASVGAGFIISSKEMAESDVEAGISVKVEGLAHALLAAERELAKTGGDGT